LARRKIAAQDGDSDLVGKAQMDPSDQRPERAGCGQFAHGRIPRSGLWRSQAAFSVRVEAAVPACRPQLKRNSIPNPVAIALCQPREHDLEAA
jgi:hypothetical protein